jgi:hypothetical protein
MTLSILKEDQTNIVSSFRSIKSSSIIATSICLDGEKLIAF